MAPQLSSKGEVIHRMGGYKEDAYTYIPVVVVGAGESGIAMGCRLKEKLGFDQFRIYDRLSGIGGTWWSNRYPGAACDVPAVFYSFSFCPNPNWTAFHPPGPEIVEYLQGVCDKYEIYDKIQLDTDVEECRWSEGEQLWNVTLRHLVHGTGDLSHFDRQKIVDNEGSSAVYQHREYVKCRVLVSCVGGLVEPKSWPADIPGFDKFQGRIFHSSRWDHSIDLNDKDVVVVGTGCSAAQFVPRLPKAPYNARSVTQLMRTPPWVYPRHEPPGGDDWHWWAPRVFNTVPGSLKFMRLLVATLAEIDWRLFPMGPWNAKERTKLEGKLLKHMQRSVPEKYHKMLTPNYGVGCKRRIYDAYWFPSLNNPKIELTTMPLARLNEHSVTLNTHGGYPLGDADAKAPGEGDPAGERDVPADVVVLANGFVTTKFLHPMKVIGRTGEDLVDVMESRGGAQAYQGTAMDGFPNFFMIFGPNTATGHSSVILATENMVEYSLPFIQSVLNGEASTVEVKEKAEREYTADIQASLKNTVWQSGGCHSWYFRDDGWNGTVYPYSQIHFGLRCMFPKYSHWDIAYTRKGLLLNGLRRTLRTLLFAAVVAVAVLIRRNGIKALTDRVRGYAKAALENALSVI